MPSAARDTGTMNTGFPGPADYSSRRSTTTTGPRSDPWEPNARPRGFPSAGLRASDAERDAALAELSQHYQAGRLTTEELDERTSRILAARTGDELELQLHDLPNLAAPAPTPPPYPQPRQPRFASHATPRLIGAVVVLAVIAAILTLGSGHHHGGDPWDAAVPVLIILLVVRRLLRRL
jgi:hypothetical protein